MRQTRPGPDPPGLRHQSQGSHLSCIRGPDAKGGPRCGSSLSPGDLFLVKGLILGWGLLGRQPELQAEDRMRSAGGLRSDGLVGPPCTGLLECTCALNALSGFCAQNPTSLDMGRPMFPVPTSLEVSWLPPSALTCFPQSSSHQPLSLLAQGRNEPGKSQKTWGPA